MTHFDIATLDGQTTTLDEATLTAFNRRFHGTLLRPGDTGYDAARRVWNGMIDRRPALIAQCAGTDDVIAAVQFARTHDLRVAVHGGGHNVAGTALCDDGLVIDLSRMADVHVDPDARRVHAQGGATIGDVDRATQPHGLATPMGVVTETGIGGLTLGGGYGWLRRKHGLSCDALRSVDVVMADGQLITASEDEHADLFWAVRGGGTVGVVTRFEYALYDVGPEVFFLVAIYPIAEARHVLQHMRAYMPTAPDAFSPISFMAHVPPLDEIPESSHGDPCLFVVGLYAGDVAEGERTLAPLRDLGTPIADLSGPAPYLEVQQFFDEDYPNGKRYYWTSINVKSLRDDAIDRLIALNDDAPSLESTIDLWFQGGAMGRVAPDATAFGDRSAPVLVGVEANWHDETADAANVAWARRCVEAMRPFSDGSTYLNFPGFWEEGDALQQAAHGANYERLQAIKQQYDPQGLFARPAAATADTP
jgi:hypothetical protein